MANVQTPVTPIPGPPKYQVLGQSPHTQRFGVFRRSLVIKDIAIGNHTGLGNALTAWGPAVVPEGSIMFKAVDQNWYLLGVTGAPAAELNNGRTMLSVLVDPYDTNYNGAGNPVVGQAYFSGCFILSFLQVALNTPFTNSGANNVVANLRSNDIMVEGTSQVQPGTPYPGLGYGVSIPMEDAPV